MTCPVTAQVVFDSLRDDLIEPADIDRLLPVRLPLGPLLTWLDTHRVSGQELARRGWDLSGQTRRRGTVSWEVADKIAGLLNVHPTDIWGDLWWGTAP